MDLILETIKSIVSWKLFKFYFQLKHNKLFFIRKVFKNFEKYRWYHKFHSNRYQHTEVLDLDVKSFVILASIRILGRFSRTCSRIYHCQWWINIGSISGTQDMGKRKSGQCWKSFSNKKARNTNWTHSSAKSWCQVCIRPTFKQVILCHDWLEH